jgi:glutamate-1-semialdehyde 2,1-aminomutase
MIPPAVAARLRAVRAVEDERFVQRTTRSADLAATARDVMPNGVPMGWMAGLYRHLPPWVSHGDGPEFVDVDGNRYIDFNLADLSAPAGFTPEPIIRAVHDQSMRGVQFLLPTTDSIDVSRLLAARFGLPFWQFTLSASTANVEAIRLAREFTGRPRTVVFAGKYHGHIDDTLWQSVNGVATPELRGLATRAENAVTEVPFNDIGGLTRALDAGDVAAVVLEPALTNCGVVLPAAGFLDDVRQQCTLAGALMIVDETHTQMAMYGGLTRRHSLSPDIVTAGKGIGGGVPIGVYGVTTELARCLEALLDVDIADAHGLAVGGTLFANALSMAAALAGLQHVFTEQRHAAVEALGGALSDGIDELVQRAGLPWRAHRLGARSGYCLEPQLPVDADDAAASLDPLFTDTRKVFFANRGVWDAIASAGPHAGFAHERQHVERYLDVADEFIRTITSR